MTRAGIVVSFALGVALALFFYLFRSADFGLAFLVSVGVWSFGLLAAMISFLLNPEVKSSDDLPGHYWALLLGNACITLAGAGVWVILALLPARTTYALYRDEGTEQPIWVATFDHGNSDDNYVACREFARKLASGEDGNLTQLSCDSVEGLPPPVFRPAER